MTNLLAAVFIASVLVSAPRQEPEFTVVVNLDPGEDPARMPGVKVDFKGLDRLLKAVPKSPPNTPRPRLYVAIDGGGKLLPLTRGEMVHWGIELYKGPIHVPMLIRFLTSTTKRTDQLDARQVKLVIARTPPPVGAGERWLH